MALPEQPSALTEKGLLQSIPTSIHEEKIEGTEHNVVTQDWTDEEERAVVRKIDLSVFPMLCLVFGVSIVDRVNTSAAYIAGLSTDVGLAQGSRYNIVLLVFFIGYALFEIPSNMAIRRVGPKIWLTFLIVVWGTIVMCMGFIHSWKSLTVLRALLGIFEAGIYPGAVYIIASWYKKFEMAQRISFFYMSAYLASGFGPILAYVLSLIKHGDGIYRQGWRWIFIIEGVLTIFMAVFAPFSLTEFPEKAKFLNERQKYIAMHRLREGLPAEELKHATMGEVLRMLKDWKLLFYCFPYYVVGSSIYALAYFQPIILREGLGFSYALSQLLSGPPYIFAMVATMTTAWLSDRLRVRWPIICAQALIAIAGLLIILYGKAPGFRYFGLFIAVWGSQANGPQILAYAQNQTSTMNKKGVLAALMITAGAAGGVTGSTIFRAQDAPDYLPGMWTTIALQFGVSGTIFVSSMYLKRQNRLLDEGKVVVLEGVPGFRYTP